MTRLLALSLLLAVSAAAQPAETAGRVLDALTGAPVPGATIRVDGTARGTAADADGRFRLALGAADHLLRVSAVGYVAQRVAHHGSGPLVVRLAPSTSALTGVTVDGERTVAGDPSVSTRTPATTDDLLAHLPGVALIQRANFAWEPVVRGYQGSQISLTVDGMPVYGACVDRMDPASSYVEPENLRAVEVARGGADLSHGSQIGGAVDLVTERPVVGAPLAVEVESGIESQGTAHRLRGVVSGSAGPLALRVSGSYRSAGDYAPGGGEAIPTSGYSKRNLAAAAVWQIADGHALTAQALLDDAWLVGYPALLMDATLAQARIGSLTYTGRAPGADALTARLYHTRVDHAMDDRFRDVMARPVMRGMYMPMAGYTDVWGGRVDAERMVGATHVSLTADAHRVGQFGDMWMYSLFPGIRDMYLLNVGDARATNAALAGHLHRSLTDRLTVEASARLDASWRDARREEIRSVFAARYGSADLARRLLVPSASATATLALTPRTRLRASVADAGRLPSLVEMYGHYVYNYVDGYFYTGRPDVRPERSRQVEVGVSHARPGLALEAAAFAHQLRDLVVGVPDTSVTAGLSGSTYRFRLTDNAARGWMAGGELSGLLDLSGRLPGVELAASVSATAGHNTSFDEPLPLMPPVGGVVALRYARGAWSGEAESRWALAQNRVARVSAAERATDGFNVLALRLGWRPAGPFRVQAGVENLLDARYREHLALSDLAARGRSVYAAVTVAL
jgi:iron complex outermembrane receptor protein